MWIKSPIPDLSSPFVFGEQPQKHITFLSWLSHIVIVKPCISVFNTVKTIGSLLWELIFIWMWFREAGFLSNSKKICVSHHENYVLKKFISCSSYKIEVDFVFVFFFFHKSWLLRWPLHFTKLVLNQKHKNKTLFFVLNLFCIESIESFHEVLGNI